MPVRRQYVYTEALRVTPTCVVSAFVGRITTKHDNTLSSNTSDINGAVQPLYVYGEVERHCTRKTQSKGVGKLYSYSAAAQNLLFCIKQNQFFLITRLIFRKTVYVVAPFQTSNSCAVSTCNVYNRV